LLLEFQFPQTFYVHMIIKPKQQNSMLSLFDNKQVQFSDCKSDPIVVLSKNVHHSAVVTSLQPLVCCHNMPLPSTYDVTHRIPSVVFWTQMCGQTLLFIVTANCAIQF